MYRNTIIRFGLAGVLSLAVLLSACGGGGSGGGSGDGASEWNQARGVAVDSAGNIYIAGDTNDTLGQSPMGNDDMFLIKNGPGGATEWIQRMGTALQDIAYGVAVDNTGSVYVAGTTQYDPWSSTGMGGCVLLIRYDGNGVKTWDLVFRGDGAAGAYAVAADNSGHAFVAGFTTGSIDGTTPNAGGQDLFLTKLDSDGNELWSRQTGTSGTDLATGVAVDRNGNSYVAGTTYGGLDGNASAGGADAFLSKFDGAGNRLWTRQKGTSGNDYGNAVAVDNNGNVVIVGETYGAMDGNANTGQSDLFAVKFDTDGNRLWTRQIGTSMWDRANGVAIDRNGNIYVAGTNSGGSGGIVLYKLDGDGNTLWTRQPAGNGSQYATAVAVDGTGNITVVGASSSAMFNLSYLVVRYDSAGNRL